MHRVLLGLALTASLSVPASAEAISTASGFSSLSAFGSSGSGDLRSLSGRPAGHHGRFGGDHRRHIRVGDGAITTAITTPTEASTRTAGTTGGTTAPTAPTRAG